MRKGSRPGIGRWAPGLLCAGLLAAGCGGAGSLEPVTGSPEARLKQTINRTVAAPLAQALASGNRAAAEALLSRSAAPRAKELLLAAAPANAGVLSEARLSVKGPVGSGEDAGVELSGYFRYGDLQSRFPLRLIASLRREDRWRISDLAVPRPPPWVDSHPLRLSSFPRSVIVHPPDLEVETLSRLIEQAASRLGGKAPGDEGRYLVVAAPGGPGAQAGALDDEKARVVFGWMWDGKTFKFAAPPYLTIEPGWLKEAATAEQRRVVAHEWAHLALSKDTMPYAPLWLQEGLAMHFSDDLPADDLVSGRQQYSGEVNLMALTRLNRPFRAFDVDEKRIAYRYAVSAAAVNNLIARFGEPRVLEFLFAYRTAFNPDDVRRTIRQKGSVGNAVPVLALSATRRLLREKFAETIDGLQAQITGTA